MKRRPWAAVIVLALFLPAACTAGWQTFNPAPPRSIPPEQLVSFDANGTTYQLHAVKLTRDSISGIPWTEHTSCDTCRIAFAAGEISHVRTGDPGRTAWNIVLPVVGFFTAAIVILCFNGCPGGD